MTSKIKQAAYKFLKEYKIRKLTLERITEIISVDITMVRLLEMGRNVGG